MHAAITRLENARLRLDEIIDLDWPVWEALGYPNRPVTVTVEECNGEQ